MKRRGGRVMKGRKGERNGALSLVGEGEGKKGRKGVKKW